MNSRSKTTPRERRAMRRQNIQQEQLKVNQKSNRPAQKKSNSTENKKDKNTNPHSVQQTNNLVRKSQNENSEFYITQKSQQGGTTRSCEQATNNQLDVNVSNNSINDKDQSYT